MKSIIALRYLLQDLFQSGHFLKISSAFGHVFLKIFLEVYLAALELGWRILLDLELLLLLLHVKLVLDLLQ